MAPRKRTTKTKRNENARKRHAELVGETSTILARIQAGEPGSPIRLMPVRICPGVVESCGMTLDNTRDLWDENGLEAHPG